MTSEWRLIPFTRYDPYFKTGLNKALMESVADGGDPIVFLSGWDRKCINLGYSQVFEQEVNVEEFRSREDVLLVRRQGGGGTTFLTPEGEITWGIVGPEEMFSEDVNEIYHEVCGRIAKGLEKAGIDAEHEPINDIVTEEGKISGATLKREDGTVYIGGTLLYSLDAEEMFSLINPSEKKKKDKQIQDYRNRVSSVSGESEVSYRESIELLKDSLLKGKKFYRSELKDREKARAEELANKYRDDKWLYRDEYQ